MIIHRGFCASFVWMSSMRVYWRGVHPSPLSMISGPLIMVGAFRLGFLRAALRAPHLGCWFPCPANPKAAGRGGFFVKSMIGSGWLCAAGPGVSRFDQPSPAGSASFGKWLPFSRVRASVQRGACVRAASKSCHENPPRPADFGFLPASGSSRLASGGASASRSGGAVPPSGVVVGVIDLARASRAA